MPEQIVNDFSSKFSPCLFNSLSVNFISWNGKKEFQKFILNSVWAEWIEILEKLQVCYRLLLLLYSIITDNQYLPIHVDSCGIKVFFFFSEISHHITTELCFIMNDTRASCYSKHCFLYVLIVIDWVLKRNNTYTSQN